MSSCVELPFRQDPKSTMSDMDIIDILWNQDMDMGVGREMFDPNLRLENEKKRELEQKQIEEKLQKEKEQMQAGPSNYIIDVETGERIPLPHNSAPSTQVTDQIFPLVEDLESLNMVPPFTTQESLDVALEELSDLLNVTNAEQNAADGLDEIQMNQQPLVNNISMASGLPQYKFNAEFPANFSGDPWSYSPPQPQQPLYTANSYPDHFNSSNNSTNISFLNDLLGAAENSTMGMNLSQGMANVFSNSTSEDSAISFGKPSPNATSWSDSHSMNSDFTADSMEGASGYSSPYRSDLGDNGFFEFEPFRGSLTNVSHNHTYGAAPGGQPHIRKMDMKIKKEPSRGVTRDEKRCAELDVPFSVSTIIDTPIEEFNDLLRRHSLNDNQLSLVRDIRRRGKNKAAAQNCRKKKINEIGDLEGQLEKLRHQRDTLLEEKQALAKMSMEMQKHMNIVQDQVFSFMRDEDGQTYDRQAFSLEVTDDESVKVVHTRSSTTNSDKNSRTNRKRRYEQ